jgi:hypothetical protein
VRGFSVESVLEALQFENEGGALRSHCTTLIRVVDSMRRGFIEMSRFAWSYHALTPCATGARPTAFAFPIVGCATDFALPIVGCAIVFAFGIDCGADAGRPADAPTRAKISWHEPNAIALPS